MLSYYPTYLGYLLFTTGFRLPSPGANPLVVPATYIHSTVQYIIGVYLVRSHVSSTVRPVRTRGLSVSEGQGVSALRKPPSGWIDGASYHAFGICYCLLPLILLRILGYWLAALAACIHGITSDLFRFFRHCKCCYVELGKTP
jgi:hypothetical protein